MRLDGQTQLLQPFPKAQGSMRSEQVDAVIFHSIYLNSSASGTERDRKLTVDSIKALTQVTTELRLACRVGVCAVTPGPAPE